MSGQAPVYLDHNATTPVHAAVRDAMLPWLGERFGNPSSGHVYGREAARAVAHARASVARLIGADPGEIYFTSGGTEADNLALRVQAGGRELVTSAIEHPAVARAAEVLELAGWRWRTLDIDGSGRVDLGRAEAILAEPCDVLSVMLAHNETGAIQPVGELAALATAANPGVFVHTDAAQAVGKIEVNVDTLGVDLLTLVGHKFYAPCGIGALYCTSGSKIDPLVHGGGQEGGLRSGTEPVALIVALGAACDLALDDLSYERARQEALRDQLWHELHQAIPALVRTLGGGAECLPNTLHVYMPGCEGAAVLAATPEVAASTGSACHDDGQAVVGVLGAMGMAAEVARGAIRLSLGRSTCAADVVGAAKALALGVRKVSASG